MKNRLLAVLAALLQSAGFAVPARAHEAAAGDVRIFSTVNSGGSVQSSGDVRTAGFVGEPGTVSSGGDVVVRSGGNSMVFYAAGFSVSSDVVSINEQGAPDAASTRARLRGNTVFDDATVGVVEGAQVAWTAPATDSPLASISADGLAQASTVYTNTPVSFSGRYSGISATNSLTVLNILTDNYRQWAGDSFDDAWEIAQGMTGAVNPDAINNGVPNWQLYAMGFNPEAPAPAALTSPFVTNGYLTVRYTRNPYATDYAFTSQESTNLVSGFTNMVNPFSQTNLVGGNEQIITRGSEPISSTNRRQRQFLRVKVTQPAP